MISNFDLSIRHRGLAIITPESTPNVVGRSSLAAVINFSVCPVRSQSDISSRIFAIFVPILLEVRFGSWWILQIHRQMQALMCAR
jgi:hypothetical protein